ncbi:MAG: FHA domain-containing protein [Bacteriovoracaceae bacterium]
MKVVLQISNTSLKVRSEIQLSLGQSATFGRSGNVDYVIEDGKMSSKHCRMLLKEDRLEIIDMSSKNGTYLNGIRIDQSEMFIGDEVRIGDTYVTILSSKLQPEIINMLTFPGPFKERLQYELKADFTGAREANQEYTRSHQGERSAVYSANEIGLRKKAQTRIRLSKDEIRSRSPLLSTLSFVIDIAILLAMILLPVYFMNRASQHGFLGISAAHFVDAKIVYISVMEIIVIGLYLASQKYLKYTIGEKISGIEDLHRQQ